jgi:hypothetical protein
MSSVMLKDTASDSDKAMSSVCVTTSRLCRLSLLIEAAAEGASLLEWVSWCVPLLERWGLSAPKDENKSVAAFELAVGVVSVPLCIASSMGK